MGKPNPWMSWLAKTWKSVKAKGGTYKEAMVEAKKTYKRGTSDALPKKKAPRKRRKK